MKRLADINVLLALATDRHAHHAPALAWWNRLAPDESLCICRPVQMGFLRLLCTRSVMGDDTLDLPGAWELYARMLASGRMNLVLEPPGVERKWAQLCRPFAQSPKIVMDAYLAAFAVAGGFRLVTLDKGFSQFPELTAEWPAC